MAIYRLTSWPEPPPKLYRNRRRAVYVLVLAVLLLAGGVGLFFHLGGIPTGPLPPFLAILLFELILAVALVTALFAALHLLTFPKRIRKEGLQNWELSPAGFTHRYPGRPDTFVPADALTGFFTRKSGSITLRATKPSLALFLPPSLADREAFQAELRSMRIPEQKPPARITLRLCLSLLFSQGCIGLAYLSHRPLLILVGGLGFAAWYARLMWTSARRSTPDRSPLRSAPLYIATIPWLLITAIRFYDAVHPHRHSHYRPAPQRMQRSTHTRPNTPP